MKAPALRVEPSTYNYPSLFGRYTAVFADHERLHLVLAQLREMNRIGTAGEDFPAELRPGSLLPGLLAALEEHFRREESEQYFGTIAAASPALQEAISALRAEHEALLRATQGLLALAGSDQRERGLSAATDGLLDWLERHERHENHIMSAFLSSTPDPNNSRS